MTLKLVIETVALSNIKMSVPEMNTTSLILKKLDDRKGETKRKENEKGKRGKERRGIFLFLVERQQV